MSRVQGTARTRDRWHLHREGEALTLSRRWPARFDVMVETTFPAVRAAALAHEVRKDLWRSLRRIRGLSPVIRIDPAVQGLRLCAGARLDAPQAPKDLRVRIAALLADPVRRTRWIAHAGRGRK